MRARSFVTLFVMLALAVTASVVWADPVTWEVYPGDSIQEAINLAYSGDTIIVHQGTYDESIVIDGKDLSLIAEGPVAIVPTSACLLHGDVIQVYNSTTTIEGFSIDANYASSGCLGGIYARGGCGDDSLGVSVTVTDNTVTNYGKNGITVNCELASGWIYDNVVRGRGELPYGDWAQNGVQFGWGAMGEARGNTITDHWWTGCTKPGQTGCTNWFAAGLLLYDVEVGVVKPAKSANTFMRNQFDVLAVSSQSLNPGQP